MKIVVLNGSPKGQNSITLQTVHYWQARFPAHEMTILHVGQRIKSYARDLSELKAAIDAAQLVLFSYPVYTFLAPYQLHRLIELLKEQGVRLDGKYATQLSTSKHFYDTTAHRFIEQNCYDLGAKYLHGLSADMDDLLHEQGRKQADDFFSKLLFDIEHDDFVPAPPPILWDKAPHTPSLPAVAKTGDKDIVLLSNHAAGQVSLGAMIDDFVAACPHPVRHINIAEFAFSGGCLGCFSCASTAQCVYKDGFERYLREEIQTADAIVYAMQIENHFTGASFKCYDDRQFCNGHRTVTHGMPVGYLISGPYQQEDNVRALVEARSDVAGTYLCGVATDEDDAARAIARLVRSLDYVLVNPIDKPKNFYGVGGSKIFRDLVYMMRGMMKADHRFYKEHGMYDFPHKERGMVWKMKLVGALMALPGARKQVRAKMNDLIVGPYQKVIEQAVPIEQTV